MLIQIREARSTDMAQCAQLYKEIYNTTYQGLVDPRIIKAVQAEDSEARMRNRWLEPGANFLVAEEVSESETTFLGYVSGIPSEEVLGSFWLEQLYLNTSARGKGIGKKLIYAMGKLAREQGYSAMVIDVFRGNDNAEGVYRHLGATPVNENFVEMVCELPVRATLLIWEDLEIFG